ncbi:tail fiber assembly protein [Kosakonia sacchari]|uniref:tail fiber assembly protein n=1 Tax=Kosakonia sacchari TaxID=1158459 RepID=UPI001585014F|nr:tail fiber assembly protein [Kosakonia sacchari]NUL36654.1 tail fiber assembly protein [Kosakonia sacchari]
MYQYSPSGNFFTNTELRNSYAEGEYPADAVDVTDDIFWQFAAAPPEGMTRIAGEDGLPAWGELPPLSRDELMARVEAEKALRVMEANSYLTARQWPGKAVLGRLKGGELSQYKRWLDYLDALDALDIAASEIAWPPVPSA